MRKAENTVDQNAVKLFDGSTTPKIIKSDRVVSITVNSGKKRVKTYRQIEAKIVPINKNPIPFPGRPKVVRSGLSR